MLAQSKYGEISRNAAGAGSEASSPSTLTRIAGTQIQCRISLPGLRWLSEYSSSQACAVLMMTAKLRPHPAPSQLGCPRGGNDEFADTGPASHAVLLGGALHFGCTSPRNLSAVLPDAHQGARSECRLAPH